LRLLSDAAFNEEFDIVVDEIVVRYVAGGFIGKEKEQVEQHFLRTPERRDKVRVMTELLRHSATTRGKRPVAASPTPVARAAEPGLFARFVTALSTQPLTAALATTVAVLVIAVGIVFLVRSAGPRQLTYAFTLQSSEAERGPGESGEPKSIKIPPNTNKLTIQLQIAPQQVQPKSYRAEFVAPATPRELPVIAQHARSVVVSVPPNLKPDRYAIRLYAILPDGQEQRLPGSYVFQVQ
jgi:hypothetical protein